MTAEEIQGWLRDFAERAGPMLADALAVVVARLDAWSAALPMSPGMQLFVGIEIVLLVVVLLAIGRRRRRRRTNATASTPSPAASTTRPYAEPSDSFAGYLAAGLIVVVAMVGGFGGWAATSRLAGAVIASGTVVVDSNVKKVQHPTGGIVGEIRVRDGDQVAEGQLLIRLDQTMAHANLQVITKQLDELAMRQARLKAERDGADAVVVPPALAGRAVDPMVAEVIGGETALFSSRRTGRTGQKSQLRERMAQLDNEISGLSAQMRAKASEIDLIRIELDGQTELWEKNLVSIGKITATRRQVTRLSGEHAQLTAQIAQAKGRIAEIELQILQIDQDMRTEVVRELRDAQAKEGELQERRIAAEDQLRRIDIRSPQAGKVHQLTVHTVGGVISQSEPVMLIVPADDKLVIEARIAPQDIDHVRAGQIAVVRFSAFNQHTTPELDARVQRVSADLTRDQQQSLAFYVVRLTLPPQELSRLGDLKLVPGMPAEVYIKTGERTALSYLVKPLSDQFQRAFRER